MSPKVHLVSRCTGYGVVTIDVLYRPSGRLTRYMLPPHLWGFPLPLRRL